MITSRRLLACLALGVVSGAATWMGCGGDDSGGLIQPTADASASDANGSGLDANGASDAGADTSVTCHPSPPSQPAWKVPDGYPKDACTTAQIGKILTDCYGSTFDKTKCDGDQTSLAACWTCLVTNESASSLGPLIHQGDFSTVNYPGCIAIKQANRTPASCGASQGVALDCQMLSCANPCSGLDAGGPSKVAAYNECLAEVIADGGACQPYEQTANGACPPSDPSYAVCYANGDPFSTYAARVAAVFCIGGAPVDGGADGGDAATTDAGDAGAGDAASDAPDGD